MLDATRRRMEKLLTRGLIPTRAAEQAYEALFLNAFTAFEAFVEELFVGLMVAGGPGSVVMSGIARRATVRTSRIARELALGGRSYADWLPFDLTEKRAHIFFRGGLPFTALGAASKDILRKGGLVRNAIAHKSRYSLSMFEQHVIGATPLPPRERTPAGFLRGTLIAAPPQTRFESFTSSILVAARALAK